MDLQPPNVVGHAIAIIDELCQSTLVSSPDQTYQCVTSRQISSGVQSWPAARMSGCRHHRSGLATSGWPAMGYSWVVRTDN